MKGYLALGFLAAMAATSARAGSPDQEHIWKLRQRSEDISFALWVRETPPTCASTNLSDAASALDDMRGAEEAIAGGQGSPFDIVRQAANMQLNELTPVTLQLHFQLADAALERGCLTVAEHFYRAVIRTYTGGRYAGERDRARLGLDDVRDRRPRDPTPPAPPASAPQAETHG